MAAPKLTPEQQDYQKHYGLLYGSVFAAVIALMWTGIFSSLLGGAPRVIWLSVLLIVGLVSLIRGIHARVKYPLSKGIKLPYLHSGRFWAKFYGVIVIEVIVIFFSIRLLQAHHVDNAVLPLIVFVVGAHFYPLAYVNGNRLWYITASVLCAAMLILVATTSDISTTTIFDAPHSSLWAVVSSGAMVATMLLTSLISSQLYRKHSLKKPRA